MKLGIALGAKMSVRNLHSPSLESALRQQSIDPIFYLPKSYLEIAQQKRGDLVYRDLCNEKYADFVARKPFVAFSQLMRRFSVLTESRDEKFRASAMTWLEGSKRNLGHTGAIILALDVLSRSRWLAQLMGLIERNFYHADFHSEQFLVEELGAVLVPAMGGFGFWPEAQFALSAQKNNLPVVSVITNFDNLLNRGRSLFTPHHLAVWGPQMAKDAEELHGIDKGRISVTGPIQFDRYFVGLKKSREEFFASRGLDAGNKTVFLAGGADVASEVSVCSRLRRYFGDSINIIYRPYPEATLFGSAAWQGYLSLLRQDPAMYVSMPDSIGTEHDSKNQFSLDLSLSEEDELAYLLRYSDVLLNYFSTISLEAALCDLPTIQVTWRSISMRHLLGQTHNMRESRLRAARLSRTEDDLCGLVNRYLEDRSLERAERRAHAENECGVLDGRASLRVAALVKDAVAD